MGSMEKILGSEHRWTIDAQSNVADILWNQGISTDAITLKEQATIASKKALGDDHPDTSTRVNELNEWKGTITASSIFDRQIKWGRGAFLKLSDRSNRTLISGFNWRWRICTRLCQYLAWKLEWLLVDFTE